MTSLLPWYNYVLHLNSLVTNIWSIFIWKLTWRTMATFGPTVRPLFLICTGQVVSLDWLIDWFNDSLIDWLISFWLYIEIFIKNCSVPISVVYLCLSMAGKDQKSESASRYVKMAEKLCNVRQIVAHSPNQTMPNPFFDGVVVSRPFFRVFYIGLIPKY